MAHAASFRFERSLVTFAQMQFRREAGQVAIPEGEGATDAFKLPLAFDPARLARDAELLEGLATSPQPGPYHNGEWSGVAIHSAGGAQSAAPSFPTLHGYEYTPEADQAPYLKEILSILPFPLQTVRVLRLPPGGAIGRHFDFDTNFQFGLIRLHIPLQTNPDVEFLISDRRVEMQVGELWYGDFSRPHQVTNKGGQARLHAVLDVEINDALLALMPADYLAAQAKLGPISKQRPELARKEDLGAFECRFFVPGTILPLLVMGRLAELVAGASAAIRLVDGGLIMSLDGRPHCRLVRVGQDELAIAGLPSGCTLRLAWRHGLIASVALLIRGVQEDLVAARVGVARGERIPERMIRLELIPAAGLD